MEGNKILDLSNLSDEHFDSVQKAVYRCMGSDEPGKFTFATHKEVETCAVLLKKAFESTACKGVVAGGLAVLTGYGIAYGVSKVIEKIGDKKKEFVE